MFDKLLYELFPQAPLTLMLILALMFFFRTWKRDTDQEMQRLRDRLQEKDTQLRELTRTFDSLTLSLELLRERIGKL